VAADHAGAKIGHITSRSKPRYIREHWDKIETPSAVEQPAVECDLKMVAANRELPASGYALEVDGRLKAEFATARAGREELKTLLPMLQIRIYDAQTNAREEI
jgi:hypothetical protein